MLDSLLDLFFPRRSLTGERGEWLTRREFTQMQSWPVCSDRETLRTSGLKRLDRLAAGGTYACSPVLRDAVHALKYGRIREMASPLAAIASNGAKLLLSVDGAVLCPVPLYWSRRFYRGFNQAELLAECLGQILGLPVQSILRRRYPTAHQVGRSRQERLHALAGAFRCTKTSVPRHIILVDDIATTGATLDECAQTLAACGVECIQALVVARA